MNKEHYRLDAIYWQNVAKRAYARSMIIRSGYSQQRAAEISHMARRALFSLVSGPRTKEEAKEIS